VSLLVERVLILDGSYIEGRKIAFRALAKYQKLRLNFDLVGRSYAWEAKMNSASIYLVLEER